MGGGQGGTCSCVPPSSHPQTACPLARAPEKKKGEAQALPVCLPEHLRLLCHRVLLPDGVAEHGAEIRTGGAADSLDLPITLHKG